MSLRPLVVFACLVTVVLIPGAAAQFVLTVEPPAAPPTANAGGPGTASFNVVMGTSDGAQFVCAQETPITVALTVTGGDAAQGLEATVTPATLTFNVPAGPHVGGATTPWEATLPATFTATVAAGSTVAHQQHVFVVRADYTADPAPANCQPASGFTATSDEADFPVAVGGAGPGTTPSPSGNMTGGPGATGDGDANDSPAPAFLLPVLGLVAFLAARRRK